MSKKLTFRGQIPDGEQEKIKLSTMNGKTGYQITQFQIIPPSPGTNTCELLAKIFTRDQTGKQTALVNFSDGDLLATAFFATAGSTFNMAETVIFDSEITNQDVYITVTDNSGNTIATNYFLELETVALTEIQSTQLTLKNLRTIASR